MYENNPKKIGGCYDDGGQYIFPDGSFYDIYGNYHPVNFDVDPFASSSETASQTDSTAQTDSAAAEGEEHPGDSTSTYAFNWENTDAADEDDEGFTCEDGEQQPFPPKKKKNPFKTTLIVMACVLGAVFLLLTTTLIFGLFESSENALKPNITVNIEVSDKGPTKPENGLASAELLEEVKSSVVTITTIQKEGTGLGSGFILTDDGYIVTNWHVVDDATLINVELYDGRTYVATLVGGNSREDIAVLKISAKDLPKAAIGQSKNCYTGERIYAVGSPDAKELAWTVTMGIISHPNRSVSIKDSSGRVEKVMNLIQSDVAVNHGNSGGPLVNTRGEVIGIVTLKMSNTSGLGFAIPIDYALTVITRILEGEATDPDDETAQPRPMIGITCVGVVADTYYEVTDSGLKKITQEEYEKSETAIYAETNGVYVMSVDQRYNAVGLLHKGDIIVAINGYAVYSNAHVSYMLSEAKIGDEVTLSVFRGTKVETVKVTLAEEIIK